MRSFFLLLPPFSRVKFLLSKPYILTTHFWENFPSTFLQFWFCRETWTTTEDFSKYSCCIKKIRYLSYRALNQLFFPLELNILKYHLADQAPHTVCTILIRLSRYHISQICWNSRNNSDHIHAASLIFYWLHQTTPNIGKLKLRAHAPRGNKDTWAYSALRFLGFLSKVSCARTCSTISC